jgi:hypothetical protein
MGGVNPAVSPFLGIGVGNPGMLKLKGAGGDNTLAAIFVSESLMQVFSLMCGFANDLVIEAGDTTAQLAFVPGLPDLKGLGQ